MVEPASGVTERPELDNEIRRWLKLEVSRRRKAREFHVGRPVLYRYADEHISRVDGSRTPPEAGDAARETAAGSERM